VTATTGRYHSPYADIERHRTLTGGAWVDEDHFRVR
jgi:hypothetical protein